MAKFIMFLLVIIGVQVAAQTNPITSITISLPSNPDANTANWGTGTSQLTITANGKAVNGRVDGFVQESKILVIIKKNGAKICGIYTSSSAPAANFNTLTKVWSGTNAISLIGQSCTLPTGDYELSVQFFGYSNGKINPLSDEKTKAFTIRGNEQQAYQSPQSIAPVNGTIIKENDLLKPIMFKWTPVVPRPQEPVTYRLRVWQLMQGQNGTQAKTVNQPILTKDVDNLTQVIISNLYTGPCKPPYLCDFVWNIQALNRDGKPIGPNNGTSETFSFRFEVGNHTVNTRLTLISPANGSGVVANGQTKFTWLPPTPLPPTDIYKIKIVEILGNQSPEQAFRGNKPIFEKDSMIYFRGNKPIFEKDSFPNFIYPLSARPFKVGSKYAWAVDALTRDGKSIGSNVFSFSVSSDNNTATSQTYKIKIVEVLGDQSPEQAFRGNKPIFEKDSMIYFRGNKPIFEKDSGFYFRGNKPIFEKDSMIYFRGNKPIFEKDSMLYFRGNKPIFEKDSMNLVFKPGKKYVWSIGALDKFGKQQWSEPIAFTVEKQVSYHLINAKYKGKIIEVADIAYLEFELADFPSTEQFEYYLINLSTQKASPNNTIRLVKDQKLIRIDLPVKSFIGIREQGILTIGNTKKKYYINLERN